MNRYGYEWDPAETARLVFWLNANTRSEEEKRRLYFSHSNTPAALEVRRREMIEFAIEWLNGCREGRMRKGILSFTRGTFNNYVLRGCLLIPRIQAAGQGNLPRVEWIPAVDFVKNTAERRDRRAHIARFQVILRAFDHGWLSRIRRCAYPPCDRWFDAKDPRKKFHSPACKKHSYEERPGAKKKLRERRRAYMRTYRLLEKKRGSLAKKAARRGWAHGHIQA